MTSPFARVRRQRPLRVQLVAAVVLLAALGLAISGFAATTALRSYLLDRVDTQLLSFTGDDGDGRGRQDGCGSPPGDRVEVIYRLCVQDGATTGIEVVPTGTNGPRLPTTFPTTPTTLPGRGDDSTWRAIADSQGGVTRLYAIDLSDVQSTTHRLLLLEAGIGGVVLLLLAGGASFVVRRSLRPLVEVETTAEAIAAGDLSRRVPESDPGTEVGSLSASFNTMLDQVEQAFAAQTASEAEARASEGRMRRFVGDASHELRTPLTSIRGFAELYRQGALPTPDDVTRAMSRVESEASRMGLLVEDLLLLARLDQQRPLEAAPVDLLELAGDAVQDARAVDPSRTVELVAVAEGPAPVVSGDAGRLRQVLGNLTGNALTHTPSGTALELRVSTTDGSAVVDVVDHGPGICAEDRPHVFERFFRADVSRTRASGGSGLGLSIVAALVAAHAGTVEVLETPGGGATFRVTLPLA